ncbi:MAG: ATPase [Planctomycetes bacterium]|nr:ATPase [Planctomycetota bacterium]
MGYDKDTVKQAAAGRWSDILSALVPVDRETWNGRHQPCPKCSGTDRFRWNRDKEFAICSQCFGKDNGDGLDVLEWLLGIDFLAALKLVADHLGIQPSPNGRAKANRKKRPPRKFGTARGVVVHYVSELEKAHGRGVKLAKTWTYDTFSVLRFDLPTPAGEKQRKTFRPVQQIPLGPNGGTGWQAGYPTGPRSTYRRKEIEAAPTDLVSVHGGEKAVDAAVKLGLEATTCAGGEKAVSKTDWKPLLRFKVILIVIDNDAAGEKFGQAVAAALLKLNPALTIKIIHLPDLPPKGDVVEWIAAGGTRDEFLRLVDAAEIVTAEQVAEATTATKAEGLRLTDVGNGERLAKLHGSNLRFCWPWGKWFVWDGRRWRVDDTGAVAKCAKETARAILIEAAGCADDAQREALVKWAGASEKRERLSAMVDLARSEPGIPILPDQLDRDPWALNCPNGTLDPRTGELRKHAQADYITKVCPTDYLPDATCPTWEAFLDQIFAGDTEIIRFLQRLFGYCSTGSTEIHILPIFWGAGSNGKSTAVGAVMDVLGTDYAMRVPHQMLMVRRGEHHPTETADLAGKRLAASVETAADGRLNEALIKDLTGGDRQRARRMREDFWEFTPTHKLILATNHRPEIQDTTHSTWRRVKLVPFEVVIPDEEQDHALPAKLRAEAPGILAWMVAGCKAWREGGLAEPEAVQIATGEYRAAEDQIAGFLLECCVERVAATVRASTLFDCYKRYCVETGEQPISQRKFGQALTERGVDRFTSNGTWYRGVDLKDDVEQPAGGIF